MTGRAIYILITGSGSFRADPSEADQRPIERGQIGVSARRRGWLFPGEKGCCVPPFNVYDSQVVNTKGVIAE